MQQALCVVKAFPYSLDKLRVLETLASMRGEPSKRVLIEPDGVDDFEHDANWQWIVSHLKAVIKEKMHLHVPLVRM